MHSDITLKDQHLPSGEWPHVLHPLPQNLPLVSIIIPTRDNPELLRNCITGLLSRTDYPAIELCIVDNGSVMPDMLELLRKLAKDSRIRILSQPGPFNWSALNNRAVAETRGTILPFLNDDTAVLKPEWLTEMVRHALRPHAGIVGARLFYPDGRLQHGGIVLTRSSATHILRAAHPWDAGYRGQLALPRAMSAVTGACMMVPRHVFEYVHGFDENFPITCNDVEFCLRVRDAGYQVFWPPPRHPHACRWRLARP